MFYYRDLFAKYEAQETQKQIRPTGRQLTRKRINARVSIRWGNQSQEGTTDNINLKGTYIRTNTLVPVGQPIMIEMSTSEKCGQSIVIPGQVVRSDENGIGVEFKDLTPDVADKLHSFVILLDTRR